MAKTFCRQCGAGTNGSGDYKPLTCGRSECQQGEACDAFHRTNKRKSARCIAKDRTGHGCKREPAAVASCGGGS